MWLENDGEKLKTVIAESIADIRQLLRQDLKGTASDAFKLDSKSHEAEISFDRRNRRIIRSTEKY
ncbi:MAG: hypothetical protein COA42_15515 [Alteromonadaceae bacterium]|nr:MAG: hypothetical protein COA42_15515 [Alteromonadaceae bacterium]